MAGRALPESLLAFVDAAMDAVLLFDTSEALRHANPTARALFRLPNHPEGLPLAELVPARFHASHAEHVADFAKTGRSGRRMDRERVLWARRLDGSEFPIEASIIRADVDGERLLGVSLRDISERLAERQALREAHDEVRELARVAAATREDEKRRVAREIHDELGQQLTALKLDLTQAMRAAEGQDALLQHFRRMAALLDRTVAEARRIAANLRPLILDDLGLEDALSWLASEFRARHPIACRILLDPELAGLGQDLASAVFRIVQEGLTNVGKHAAAASVEVSVLLGDEEVQIGIVDDGPPGTTPLRMGRGLLGIRERALSLGGKVEYGHGPEGFRILVCLPCTAGKS